jgi:hypothetical protein
MSGNNDGENRRRFHRGNHWTETDPRKNAMRIVFGLVLLVGIALPAAVYMARDYVTQYQSQLAGTAVARPDRGPPRSTFKNPPLWPAPDPRDVQLVRWP